MSESLPGEETDVSTSADDNSSSVECPTCGDTFPTELGMKSHHGQVHGESIAPDDRARPCTATCIECGDDFPVQEYRKDSAKFCTHKCQGRYYQNRVKVTCEQCGDDKHVPASRVDRFRFCSPDCHADWLSENQYGENHH